MKTWLEWFWTDAEDRVSFRIVTSLLSYNTLPNTLYFGQNDRKFYEVNRTLTWPALVKHIMTKVVTEQMLRSCFYQRVQTAISALNRVLNLAVYALFE